MGKTWLQRVRCFINICFWIFLYLVVPKRVCKNCSNFSTYTVTKKKVEFGTNVGNSSFDNPFLYCTENRICYRCGYCEIFEIWSERATQAQINERLFAILRKQDTDDQ